MGRVRFSTGYVINVHEIVMPASSCLLETGYVGWVGGRFQVTVLALLVGVVVRCVIGVSELGSPLLLSRFRRYGLFHSFLWIPCEFIVFFGIWVKSYVFR